MFTLTPPYHYSIVACSSAALPLPNDGHVTAKDNDKDDKGRASASAVASDLLYRGSLPAARNLAFLSRLGLRTIVYMRKKELKRDDGLVEWAQRRDVVLRWIKAEEMGEESLGMGKTEVLDVLKIILDTSSYPLYIADLDGISHTTLVVACLRKLQGWHQDSIVNEICRFEPDHEDLPLVPFLNNLLSPPPSKPDSEPAFTLPPPPYPAWLWPAPPAPPPSSPSSRQSQSQSQSKPPAAAAATNILPFAHPTTARRHPTMRIAFPSLPAPTSPTALPSPGNAGTGTGAQSPLSRHNSRRGLSSPVLVPENQPSLLEQASAVVHAITEDKVLSGLGLVQPKGGRMVSFTGEDEPKQVDAPERSSPKEIASSTSTERREDNPGVVSLDDATDDTKTEDTETYDEDEDEYDDADEDDEDEDDEDQQPTSQYISALDLAGFG